MFNRIQQTKGRAIRNFSHCHLPYIKRNTQIFLYGSHLGDMNEYDVREEAMDLYMYRNAEIKGIKIGKISRLLKENSIDCKLHEHQTHMFQNFLNKTVAQKLSTGEIISNYKIGDAEFSIQCDFMECDYQCKSGDLKNESIDSSTYNEYFMNNNIDTIINKIKELFKKKFLYTKDELIKEINYSKIYPIKQINSALNKMVNNKNQKMVDIIGRNGILKNVNNLYIFNPEELDIDTKLSNYHTRKPINIRPEKINIQLDNPIDRDNKMIEQDVNINKDELFNRVNQEFKYIFSQNQNINKKYAHKSVVITMFLHYFNIEIDILKKIVIQHIIENLNINEKKIILMEINQPSSEEKNRQYLNDEVLQLIVEYFNMYSIEHEDKKYYILNIFHKNKNKINDNIYLFKVENDTISKIEIKSRLESIIIKKFKISKNKISNIFGYKINTKLASIFKIKDWKTNKKNTTGKQCTLFGNKETQLNLINYLTNIAFNKNKYTIDDGKVKQILNNDFPTRPVEYDMYPDNLKFFFINNYDIEHTKTLDIKPKFLCFEIEILFRYLNFIQKNDKRWFFSNNESYMFDLNKFPIKNQISRKFLN